MTDVPRRRLPLFSRLDRYVASHFLWSYASALGLVMGLFVVLDMAQRLDDWFEGGGRNGLLLRYHVLTLPFSFLQVAPFVTLIAAMFTVNRLLRKNEIAAALGAGISAHRLMLPVYLAGIALVTLMFTLREAVGHGLADRRDALLDLLEHDREEQVLENVVVRDISGTISILDRFLPEPAGGGPPQVLGLSVRRRYEGKYTRIAATRAVWDPGGEGRGAGWRLEDGHRRAFTEGEAADEPLDFLAGTELTPAVALTYRRARDNPLELSFSEVLELLRREPDHPAWQTLWHYHLTFPLANLVLLLVGIPVMFTYERGRGADRMALGGLLCVFYFGLDFVLRSLGLGGGLDPALAAWLPVLLFGSLGVVMTDSLRT